MSNVKFQMNQQRNYPNKIAFIDTLQEKNTKQNIKTKNLIDLHSSIFIDATKYISIGLTYQQNEDFENSKVNMEKGVTLIKEIFNTDNTSQDRGTISHEYV